MGAGNPARDIGAAVRSLALASLSVLFACTPDRGQPAATPGADAAPQSGPPRYDAATFHDTLSVRGASFSHDEDEILIATDATGIYTVYAQPVAGGERIPTRRGWNGPPHLHGNRDDERSGGAGPRPADPGVEHPRPGSTGARGLVPRAVLRVASARFGAGLTHP